MECNHAFYSEHLNTYHGTYPIVGSVVHMHQNKVFFDLTYMMIFIKTVDSNCHLISPDARDIILICTKFVSVDNIYLLLFLRFVCVSHLLNLI